MTFTNGFPLMILAAATLVASATDLWRFKVYNILNFPLLVAGVLFAVLIGGWEGLTSSLLGAGLGFVVLFFFFALGGVGAGDVKLLTAVGAWLGPYLTYQVFVASALSAGVYAMGLIWLRSGLLGVAVEFSLARSTLSNPRAWRRPESSMAEEVQRSDRRRRLVPYAVMICVGYFATMVWWHNEIQQVWPPFGRVSASSLALTTNQGER